VSTFGRCCPLRKLPLQVPEARQLDQAAGREAGLNLKSEAHCAGRQPLLPVSSAMTPNPSLKLTRCGRHCKPGLRYSIHCLSPGLQYLPPRAA
jgi:hypothetical protein